MCLSSLLDCEFPENWCGQEPFPGSLGPKPVSGAKEELSTCFLDIKWNENNTKYLMDCYTGLIV